MNSDAIKRAVRSHLFIGNIAIDRATDYLLMAYGLATAAEWGDESLRPYRLGTAAGWLFLGREIIADESERMRASRIHDRKLRDRLRS